MKVPRAIKEANAQKQQLPTVTLDIDPTEAWIRWASQLHTSPGFDRYAYNIPFLAHLVNLIGEEPEYIEDETAPVDAPVIDDRLLHQGSGNSKGVEAHHVKAWLQIVNVTRQAGADILGWHRSSLVKVLSRERMVTEAQAVRFLQVVARLDEWQQLQYVATVKGME